MALHEALFLNTGLNSITFKKELTANYAFE